jgi:Ni/Co efflux regulator RcnB
MAGTFEGKQEEVVRHRDGWNRKEKLHEVPAKQSDAGRCADELINRTNVQGQEKAWTGGKKAVPYRESFEDVNDYVDTDQDSE